MRLQFLEKIKKKDNTETIVVGIAIATALFIGYKIYKKNDRVITEGQGSMVQWITRHLKTCLAVLGI